MESQLCLFFDKKIKTKIFKRLDYIPILSFTQILLIIPIWRKFFKITFDDGFGILLFPNLPFHKGRFKTAVNFNLFCHWHW